MAAIAARNAVLRRRSLNAGPGGSRQVVERLHAQAGIRPSPRNDGVLGLGNPGAKIGKRHHVVGIGFGGGSAPIVPPHRVMRIVIGGIEAAGLIDQKLGLAGGLWDTIAAAMGEIGLDYGIIVLFVLAWLVSLLVYRPKIPDRIGA